MTPLADAMFQLLIFFMLASSLTPYSLLTIQGGQGPATPAATGETAPDEAPQTPTQDAVLWRVGNGGITIASQAFGFDRLNDLVAGLGTPSTPADVVILVESDARVQDLTTVLEALQTGDIASVQVATDGG